MATYGVKPNPSYFVSQLQKQQKRQLKAEVQQKRESNFKIVLYYLYDIYNPVICVFHRCSKRRKERRLDQKRRNYLERKIQESNRVQQEEEYDQEEEGYDGNLQGQDGSNQNNMDHSKQSQFRQQAEIDLPARDDSFKKQASIQNFMPQKKINSEKNESKLHRRKLEQLDQQKELIQVDFLRPSKWFYVLQYMGGLSLNWFLILILLAIIYIASQLKQTSAVLIILIGVVGPFISCFMIIFFYWYSHKLYRTSIRSSFEKTYYATLIEPLSKPRPTTGAAHQGGANQYAMMSGIMYDHHQNKQARTMDPEMLRYKVQSRIGERGDDERLRNQLVSPPPDRGYASALDGQHGGGLRSPISTDRNVLMERNAYSNRIYNREVEDEQDDGPVKDGSGNNLLMNASGNDEMLQKDQIVKSDMQGVFTKGEYAQIRRTQQDKNNKMADNILLYVVIGLMVFLLIGICVILIFYLSTAFALTSLACFFIGSILEIFLVRPLYVLLWALMKKCCQKKRTQDEYDRIDEIKPPLENPELMDQANQQAALRQFKEQEKKFQEENPQEEEEQEEGLLGQNKSGSGDGIDQEDVIDNKIINDENQMKVEGEGQGGDVGVDKLGQKIKDKIPDDDDQLINAELGRDQNRDLIQLSHDADDWKKGTDGKKRPDDQFAVENDEGEKGIDRPRLESPDPELQRALVDSQQLGKDHPQSPFGAGMSNIPRKGTASFDRRDEQQDDDDLDRVAHIIISPDKNLRSNDYPEDDEAEGFRSQSPQNLRRNQDGIPGRKVDTKNQSYVGPGSGDRDDLASPVLVPTSTVGGVLLVDKGGKQKKKGETPEKKQSGRKAPKSQSGTKNRTPGSQFGGSFEGKDDDLNDRSGELPEKQRLNDQAQGGSAIPFSNPIPVPVYIDDKQDKHPIDQGVGGDSPMHQLMNQYAQTDLPPFTAGRKGSPDHTGMNRPLSRLSALSPFGDVSKTGSIPEQAEMSQMMMNPLDDLCPYKKVMTDVIYLSCGPEGGDQVLRKLKKKPGAQDLSIEDLQKIIDQNNYEVDPDHKEQIEQDAEETLQIKPGIKPVIPIDEHPAEDEITSSMPRSPLHSQGQAPPRLDLSQEEEKDPSKKQEEDQQDKKENLTDSQLIQQEMSQMQQKSASKVAAQEQGVDVSFALNQDQKDKSQIFKVEDAEGEKAGVGELSNLDQFKPPPEDQILPIEDVNKSKSSMRYQKTPSPEPIQEEEQKQKTPTKSKKSASPVPSTRKSPSPVPSKRKSPSPVSSTKKAPSTRRTPSPKRVLMGAAIAPNAKKPSGKGIRPKQKSFQLDMADMSGTIIMSAESGGRTPPGIQASEGFFMNGPDGSQELSPVGKNRSPLLHSKKKKKKSSSPLRTKPDSFRAGPKARGILASKPEDQNIEYDQGDHEDSQEIDPTSVFFKQGMGLPFDQQASDQDYGDADIVYQKDDLTNYSKGLGINRVMNPGHLFGRRNKTKKPSKKPMRHSMYADRLSQLGTQSEDQARMIQKPRMNRSFRSSHSGRPVSLGPTPTGRRTPYDPYGQKRVDCWNHDYIMMNEIESKKPKKKKRFKKSPTYSNVQPHVYDHLSGSKFMSGEDDDMDGGETGINSNNPAMYRSGRKGNLPPLGGVSSSSHPKKGRKFNKKGSKDSNGQALWVPNNMMYSQTSDRMATDGMGGQGQQSGPNFGGRNMISTQGNNLGPTQSGFLGGTMNGINNRGRQHDRSMQGSRMFQDDDYNGSSPYNQNLFRRFHQWEPGKETRQTKRKHLNYIKAQQLQKNYGGPLQVTGIATCGGVRPSQRKKWQKQHRLLEMQRSQMFQEDISQMMGNSPLPPHHMQRQHSNRSSRSSLPPFPPQPEANFDPKFYKQYDSDGSGHLKFNNLNNSKLNRSGVINTSSHSPVPRHQHSSVQSNRLFPNIPPNGGVMNSAMKKSKKKRKASQGVKSGNTNYDPLFNPESTDEKYIGDSEQPIYESPSVRSDNPVENMASPVNFGSPGIIHDDDDEMSDDVRIKSGTKQPAKQINSRDGGLPPLPKQHTQDIMSQTDQAQIEDI